MHFSSIEIYHQLIQPSVRWAWTVWRRPSRLTGFTEQFVSVNVIAPNLIKEPPELHHRYVQEKKQLMDNESIRQVIMTVTDTWSDWSWRRETVYGRRNDWLKSNQIKFICDTKIQTPMKEVKQKVICQHETNAAKSCTDRCPDRKKLNNGYSLKWNLLSLRSKQATEVDATMWSGSEFQILMTRLAKTDWLGRV